MLNLHYLGLIILCMGVSSRLMDYLSISCMELREDMILCIHFRSVFIRDMHWLWVCAWILYFSLFRYRLSRGIWCQLPIHSYFSIIYLNMDVVIVLLTFHYNLIWSSIVSYEMDIGNVYSINTSISSMH